MPEGTEFTGLWVERLSAFGPAAGKSASKSLHLRDH
jgi:hypothetical protein